MFHVTVYVNSAKEYIGFQTSGHAGYAPEGQDIVCAAASVLTINTINAIDQFTGDRAILEAEQTEGYISYRIDGKRMTLLFQLGNSVYREVYQKVSKLGK